MLDFSLQHSLQFGVILLLVLLFKDFSLLIDVVNDVPGTGFRVVATHWFTIATDQKLLKIPDDVMLFYWGEIKQLSGTDLQLCTRTSSL